MTGDDDQDQPRILARLSKTADAVDYLRTERAALLAARDILIIQARSEGHSWQTVARAANRSIARCVAVVDRAL